MYFCTISCVSIVTVQIVNTVHGIFTVSRFCCDVMFMVLQRQAGLFCWSSTRHSQVLTTLTGFVHSNPSSCSACVRACTPVFPTTKRKDLMQNLTSWHYEKLYFCFLGVFFEDFEIHSFIFLLRLLYITITRPWKMKFIFTWCGYIGNKPHWSLFEWKRKTFHFAPHHINVRKTLKPPTYFQSHLSLPNLISPLNHPCRTYPPKLIGQDILLFLIKVIKLGLSGNRGIFYSEGLWARLCVSCKL